MGYLSNTDTCLAARVSLCLFYSHLSFQDPFIFAEYELLTAILVDTKLWGNYLFWGVTCSAKTAQLLSAYPCTATITSWLKIMAKLHTRAHHHKLTDC